MDKIAQQFEHAFWDELEKIGALNQIEGLRDNQFVKEALPALAQTAMQGFGGLASAAKQGLGRAAGAVAQGARQVGTGVQHAAVGRLIPTGTIGDAGKEMMLRKGGLFGGLMGTGRRMEQAGIGMRQTAAQRVAATPGLSAVGRVTSPQQMQEIQHAAQSMGRSDPGAAGRIGSHMVESTGHHIEHATPAGMAFKTVGIPFGGALEGLSRGVGKELHTAGSASLAAMPEAQRFAQQLRPGFNAAGATNLGRGLQTHAKTIGRVGEYAAIPAMAAAAHVPLGAAGLIGGKLLGAGAAAAAPGLEHAVHHAGDIGQYLHHAASDVVGEGSRRATGALSNLAARRGGRMGMIGTAIGGAVA